MTYLTRFLAFFILLTAGCASVPPTVTVSPAPVTKPKNIIYLIGDGMGMAHTTAYRYFADDPSTKIIEKTIFDELLVGTASTFPDDDTFVTDSAASATALSTGIKSYNGAIGVGIDKKPLESMLEIAKKKGLHTAIVSTSQINHATPASFIAHNESRNNYDAIADEYISNKINGKPIVDLMLGGGTKYFVRKDRNLVEEFKAFGYQYTDNIGNIDQLQSLPALGLFAPVGMPSVIDQPAATFHLNTMAEKALNLLTANNQHGFFMMLEGSQIDWCAHANDIACTMHELNDFAKTIETIKNFVDKNGETLLVITADHSTGGLSVGANSKYLWKSDVVRQVHASGAEMARQMLIAKDVVSVWNSNIDFTLTDTELAQLNNLLQGALETNKTRDLANQISDIVNQRSMTGWTTHGHTADDVQVFAYGVGATQFRGFQDNTDIAHKLINFLK